MAQYGSSTVAITCDDSGGTGRVITPYVDSIGGLKIEDITQETNPFGGTSELPAKVGVTKSITVPIAGKFNDTATVGPHVVFGTRTGSRTLVVATGGGTFTIEGIITGYEVMPKNNALTEYVATFQATTVGAWS